MTTRIPEQVKTRDYLYWLSLALIVIGLVVSGYLSYTKLTNTSVICLETESISCDVVQHSAYSKFAGIEIAYLGFLAYLVLGGLLLLSNRVGLLQEYGPLILFGLTLFAFLHAIWLVYAQAVLLEAFCTWCLSHEANITILFIVSTLRLWRKL